MIRPEQNFSLRYHPTTGGLSPSNTQSSRDNATASRLTDVEYIAVSNSNRHQPRSLEARDRTLSNALVIDRNKLKIIYLSDAQIRSLRCPISLEDFHEMDKDERLFVSNKSEKHPKNRNYLPEGVSGNLYNKTALEKWLKINKKLPIVTGQEPDSTYQVTASWLNHKFQIPVEKSAGVRSNTSSGFTPRPQKRMKTS